MSSAPLPKVVSGTSCLILFLIFLLLGLPHAMAGLKEEEAFPRNGVPILVYHRFGPVVTDSMTVTTQLFLSHINCLKQSRTIIPLRKLVEYRLGKRGPLPSRCVALTVDDGHRSVYTDLLPIVKRYQIPVTLFLYPSAISNASYAMTWDHLKEIKSTGLFDLQGHTYWHPNFKKEKERLSPPEYERFVQMQLKRSKEKLENELKIEVDMLSWPFGIYDEDLISRAVEAGYISAFTLGRRPATASDSIMALPRFLMTQADQGKAFEKLLGGS